MSRDRDLFRAIVISGVALVGNTGCNEEPETPDAGSPDAAVAHDAAVSDAAKPNSDAFPAIL